MNRSKYLLSRPKLKLRTRQNSHVKNQTKYSDSSQTIYNNQTQQQQQQQQQQQKNISQQHNLNKKSTNLKQLHKNIQESQNHIINQPGLVIGRKKQKKQISDFINNCLFKQINNRCLYISGCPGVGKTSTVMQVIKKLIGQLNHKKIKFIYLNALNLKKQANIYKQFLIKSKKKLQTLRPIPSLLAVEFDQYLQKCKTNYIFIIDQVDYLYTKDQNVIYNIVEWCSQAKYKFSVIMIANTIDLPQKLSAKVTSRMGNNRMCFKPYSSQQLKQIIEQRLIKSKYFEQRVIKFAAMKFSVYTSDLRKVFRVFDQAIQNCKGKKVTIEQINQLWNKIVDQEDIGWKTQLPQIFVDMIEMIKKDGGKSHTVKLTRYLFQKNIMQHQVNMMLMDMKQMGLVRLSQKTYQGCLGFIVTLIQI